MAAIFALSLTLDLFFIWNLTIGLPDNIATNAELIIVWKITFGFFFLINTLLLKVWNIYTFYKKLAKWQTGYIEIYADEIVHCEEKSKIPLSHVKFKRGYVLDDSKKSFDYILVYRISRVDKFDKAISGRIQIVGKIEMDCLDEYIGLEMGIDDQSINQMKVHSIPAYYEGMDLLKHKLEEMASAHK